MLDSQVETTTAQRISNAPLLIRGKHNKRNASGLDCPKLRHAQLPHAQEFQQHGVKGGINLVEFVAPRIYVGGQVAKPGSYDLRAGQTLMQAIILAGGFTREANRKTVLRARPTADAKLNLTTFNVPQLLTDSKTAQEVLLPDGDYVFVTDSKLTKVSRILEVFQASIPRIRTY